MDNFMTYGQRWIHENFDRYKHIYDSGISGISETTEQMESSRKVVKGMT
jgi:hypothetical protein